MKQYEKEGHGLAVLLNDVISHREDSNAYLQKFVRKMKEYSFKPRKKTEPANDGCQKWLDCLDKLDIEDPEEMAMLVIGVLDKHYNKGTAQGVYRVMMANIKPPASKLREIEYKL